MPDDWHNEVCLLQIYKNRLSQKSALLKSKRISILQPDEIDNLFGIPIFNDDDREKWFDLNTQERSLLKSKKTLEGKVDFILQLVYFKAKHQFFTFNLDDAKNDVNYIVRHFFSDQNFKRKVLGKEQRRQNQLKILDYMNVTLFSDKIHIPLLLEESASICRISNGPLFIFWSFVSFLQNNKITLPGYTTFQEKIVSVAIHTENKRLYATISAAISTPDQKLLLTLLEEVDDFYTITSLKKYPKNFKRTAIKKECSAFQNLLPLYKIAARILPLLNISKGATQYYASLVDHYTVQGLNNINKNQRLLWLICFVYQRHKLMTDNLTMMLIHVGNKFKTTVDERADELLLSYTKKPKNTDKKVAKALRFYSSPNEDDTKSLAHFKSKVYNFLPLPELNDVIDIFENKTSTNHYNRFRWQAVDELTATYKTPLRLLMKAISLNGDQYCDLQDAHKFLKNMIQNEVALSKIAFDKFPVQFISNSNANFIYNEDNKTINTNRFEFECYHRIAKAINQSSLYVENSIRFGSLKDELIPNWDTKKDSVLKKLNNDFLNKGIQHFIDTQLKSLDEKIKTINEDVINGHNKSIKIKHDKYGNTDWTLPYSRKNESIDNPLYLEFPNMGITQLLKSVHEKTGFIHEFTHIKPHYAKSKIDEFAIFATIVANAVNIGVGKMAALCDVNKNDLNNAQIEIICVHQHFVL